MTERERLTILLRQANYDISRVLPFEKTNSDRFTLMMADYLLKQGICLKVCETCNLIERDKKDGYEMNILGKPFKYCPECGKELR